MKLKSLSIKIKIMLPVAIIVALLVLSSVTTIRIANNMLSVSQEISDNYSASLVKLGKISENFEKLNSIIYKHCIATDDDVKANLVKSYKSTLREISKLCIQFKKILNEGQEATSFNEFQQNYKQYIKDYKTAINASKFGQSVIASQMANNALMTQSAKIEKNIQKMQEANQTAMNNGILEQKKVYRTSQISGITLFVIGLFLGLDVLFICYKAVCRPVARMNKDLSEIIEEINAGNGDLTK